MVFNSLTFVVFSALLPGLHVPTRKSSIRPLNVRGLKWRPRGWSGRCG